LARSAGKTGVCFDTAEKGNAVRLALGLRAVVPAMADCAAMTADVPASFDERKGQYLLCLPECGRVITPRSKGGAGG